MHHTSYFCLSGLYITAASNIHCEDQCIIKSPRYTGGDFMFLYRYVRRRRRRFLFTW